MKLINHLAVGFFTLLISHTAQAALINHTEITASTSLIPVTLNPGHPTAENTLSVDEIVDGITADLPAPYAGFVTHSATGTIRLDFANIYDLTKFTLFNDVFVSAEGVKDFRLDFFDATNNIIGNFLGTAAAGILLGQDFGISATGVSRVDLVVLSSLSSVAATQIEIREVQFEGTLSNTSAPVPSPAPAALMLLGLIGLGVARKHCNRHQSL